MALTFLRIALLLLGALLSARAAVTNVVVTWAPSASPGVVEYRLYESNAAGVKLLSVSSTNTKTFTTSAGYSFTGLGATVSNWDLSVTHYVAVTASTPTIESQLTNWTVVPPPPDGPPPKVIPLGGLIVPVPGIAQASRDLQHWQDRVRIDAYTNGAVLLVVNDPITGEAEFLRVKPAAPVPPFLQMMIR